MTHNSGGACDVHGAWCAWHATWHGKEAKCLFPWPLNHSHFLWWSSCQILALTTPQLPRVWLSQLTTKVMHMCCFQIWRCLGHLWHYWWDIWATTLVRSRSNQPTLQLPNHHTSYQVAQPLPALPHSFTPPSSPMLYRQLPTSPWSNEAHYHHSHSWRTIDTIWGEGMY